MSAAQAGIQYGFHGAIREKEPKTSGLKVLHQALLDIYVFTSSEWGRNHIHILKLRRSTAGQKVQE